MTVSTTPNRLTFAGSGGTSYVFPYYTQNLSDIKCALQDQTTYDITLLVYGTDYTVSGTYVQGFGYTGGVTITTTNAVTSGTDLVVYRNAQPLQGVSLPESGPLPTQALEAQIDQLTLALQRVEDQVSRAIMLPDGYVPSFAMALPSDLVLNAGSSIAVNNAGNGFAYGPSGTALNTAVTAAATSATAAAASATAAGSSATTGAGWASNAATSAGTASTAATNAGISATAASTSATAAAASALALTNVRSWAGGSSGTANALTLTPTPAITSYGGGGLSYIFEALNTNTGACTINISGLGNQLLVNQGGTPLVAGDIKAGGIYTITFNGGNEFYVDEVLADSAVNRAKITPTFFMPPTFSWATANGTGTGGFSNTSGGYLFSISTSSTVTAGATYTNNGQTFTVLNTIAALTGQVLMCTGTGAPASSGNLSLASGSGTTTIAFTGWIALSKYNIPTGALYGRLELVGGGGGGGGGNAGGGGGGGGQTVFGGPWILFGNGGGGGVNAGASGVGGTSSALGIASIAFFTGGQGASFIAATSGGSDGGNGGSSILGGNGGAINGHATGGNGSPNTGGGGAGGGATSNYTGTGGGAGGGIKGIVSFAGLTSLWYCIGAGGSAGSGTSPGGLGAEGGITMEEYYQ